MQSFSPEVIEKLKTYVYRLIDPRNGETFYIGKGKGNRVFAHIRAEIDTDDPNDKLKRIHEIRATGFEVAHVIHRHGLDDKTAIEVEAALIDAYPGLTNAVSGSGSNEFGAMHAQEIVNKYQAEPADFQHRIIIINVNRSATESSLYEATRYAWKISPGKATRAEIVVLPLPRIFPDTNRFRIATDSLVPRLLIQFVDCTLANGFPMSSENKGLPIR